MKTASNKLARRNRDALKEKGQYLLAFGVIASMLFAVGFPVFVIFFFGLLAFLVLRMFVAGSRSESRDIFEFYLTANEMLRDDDRRWYGFELREAIGRGEAIIESMSAAPPLVYFALGALYLKAGEHKAALNNLSHVVDNVSSDESTVVYPPPELRNYVRILRKIERDPADAPLTSAAVRSLERARRLRGKALLEQSREGFANTLPSPAVNPAELTADSEAETAPDPQPVSVTSLGALGNGSAANGEQPAGNERPKRAVRGENAEENYGDRKSITDVLHEIYDKGTPRRP
jgi:hypothetical protein